MFIVKSIEDVNAVFSDGFSCGIEELDIYLKKFARQNHKKGIGKTYLCLVDNKVVGYYAISMASIEYSTVPQEHVRGIPKYPIPVARIGRLAVDMNHQGKKIGSSLLIDALRRIFKASQVVAAYSVVVDAKNERAKKFYEAFGFVEYKNDLSLFLPMKTIENLLASS